MRIQDLPADVRDLLLHRSYAGSLRSHIAVRRLLAHLVKLGLVSIRTDPVADAPQRVELTYGLCRHVELYSFTKDVQQEPPEHMGHFDFADPQCADEYWKALQTLVDAWLVQTTNDRGRGGGAGAPAGSAADGAEDGSADDGSEEGEEDEPGGGGRGRSARGGAEAVPQPANCQLPELLLKKNWKKKAWLGPVQRAAVDEFYRQLCGRPAAAPSGMGNVMAPAPSSSSLALVVAKPPPPPAAASEGPRVVTPRSPEIVDLSIRICVPPDTIVKYCKQLAELATKTSTEGDDAGACEPAVTFSLLNVVRYRCHLCGYLCFQKTTVEDHYKRVHDTAVPEDSSLYCDAGAPPRRGVSAVGTAEQQVATRRALRRKMLTWRDNWGPASAAIADAAWIHAGVDDDGADEAADAAWSSFRARPPWVNGAEAEKRSPWAHGPVEEDASWLRLLVLAESLPRDGLSASLNSRSLSSSPVRTVFLTNFYGFLGTWIFQVAQRASPCRLFSCTILMHDIF
eukprot:TRINITY_DN15428_c0_g2_i3.p1 TRINITY_DN15428_c0_g2~~TRINITY_DN15428_c0_g2_i3.p1  ORF type:complete len:511 (-),score=109.73 TRINITY_DN15428_c0_g2_i3:1244-2776(-)